MDWNPATTPSSGSLKAKITLKFNSPFYCLKSDLPPKSQMTGSTDLLSAYDMGSVYSKFCGSKKIREDLASFLPSIYGNFNINPTAKDVSSLRQLIETPPLTGKEIQPLSATALNGFKLNTGAVDECYQHLFDRKREYNYPVIEHDPKTGLTKHKTSLEPLDTNPVSLGDDDEPERKRHKTEKEKKKKHKKDKKKNKKDEERKHKKPGEGSSVMDIS